jgi:cytochrome c oxidase subunit 2
MRQRGLARRSRRAALVAFTAAALLAACSRSAPSTLDPAGYGARRVEGLWWLMFWISTAVFVVVAALLAWALVRRRRAGVRVRAGDATRFVVITGVVLPFVVLAFVYAIGVADLAALGNRAADEQPTVEVTGHDWWWEVRYPQAGAVTANEIHIPVGRRVRVKLTSADVLHSFWVPQLSPKVDLITGKVNETWLLAERAGSYRGQCAEYCGLQHAHMAFLVVAQPQADVDAWLARLSRPRPPQTVAERRGLEVFERAACASCHTVRGTAARGTVGPDLSTVGARWSLGAGTVPNDRGHLGGWLANPQTVKPGSGMPPQPIAAGDLQDLLAYLESLK